VLLFCFCAWLLVLSGWVLLAGGRMPIRIWILAGLQFGMGLLAAIVQMANTRLAMAIIPVMGRNHFFAIYSVVANVVLGLAPVLWGLMIDVVGNRSARWAGLEWNRYTIFFASVLLVYGFTVLLARRLDEPKAASMDQMLREILVQTPLRFWLRFWPRG
jgi:MFS family permease